MVRLLFLPPIPFLILILFSFYLTFLFFPFVFDIQRFFFAHTAGDPGHVREGAGLLQGVGLCAAQA